MVLWFAVRFLQLARSFRILKFQMLTVTVSASATEDMPAGCREQQMFYWIAQAHVPCLCPSQRPIINSGAA